MALDVLKHFAEAARAAEADLQVRTRGGEAALLEEQPLLLDADDLGSVGDGRQGQRVRSSVTSASMATIPRCRASATRWWPSRTKNASPI